MPVIPWLHWLGGVCIVAATVLFTWVGIALAKRFLAWLDARDAADAEAAQDADVERYRQAAIEAHHSH